MYWSTFIEEKFNNGKLSTIDTIIHSNYKFSSTDSKLNGIGELKKFIQLIRSVFADINLCIDDIFTSDAKICTSYKGTH